MNYNKLTPAETERLALLAEEAGEIVQTVGKILRHGYSSKNPLNPYHKGNRDDLTREVADILAVISFVTVAGDFDTSVSRGYFEDKVKRLAEGTYTHHQGGTIAAAYTHHQEETIAAA